MTNEELVRRFQEGDSDALALLWEQTQRLAEKLARKQNNSAELDDLMQEGFIILHSAASDYDTDSGIMFSTYFGNRLKWGWLRYAEKNSLGVRVPAQMFWKIVKVKRAAAGWKKKHGTDATEACLSDITGISLTDIREIKKTALNMDSQSLNVSVNDENDTELIDLIKDESDQYEQVLDRLQNEELAAELWTMIDELPEDQRSILHAHYVEGMTMRAAAAAAGIDYGKARRSHDRAIKELRTSKNQKRLSPYVNDRIIYSRGIRSVGVSTFMRTWTSATEWAALYSELKD